MSRVTPELMELAMRAAAKRRDYGRRSVDVDVSFVFLRRSVFFLS